MISDFQKKDLLTSLLLDLLFLAIVFNLPVMKSMTLSELSNRPEDLANPEELLTQEEYKFVFFVFVAIPICQFFSNKKKKT